jgi:uncharacterized protein with NRDE domain
MCTLAVYVRMSQGLPLVVAANRDEFLDRPTAEPQIIAWDPWVLAGQDLVAGGTWFGINQHGMVVGLLNRRNPQGPDASLRSRGILCLQVLQCASPSEATALLSSIDGSAYNQFNLLIADTQEAFVATNPTPRIAIEALPPGVHLLTNLALNDPTCPRIAKSSQLFRSVALPPPAEVDTLVPVLREILTDHTTALDPRTDIIDTLCVHLGGYGTRSSSIVTVEADGRARYWHAPGSPCVTDYAEVPIPEA